MTVGTNALLEGRGARTALIATAGFGDLLEIGRQSRPSLYHLCRARPEPLVPPELRIEARERIGAEGVVDALGGDEVDRLVGEVRDSGAESVAVCLLFSFADPSHEARIAAGLREALPGVHVSASSEVLPAFREFERCSTTAIDAYLSPLLGRYLERLGEACGERGIPEPVVMRSSGGTAEVAEASRSGAWSVLSGPAGGAVGAAALASAGEAGGDVIGFDMGGTSCDVCVVEGGEVRRTDSRDIAGYPIQLPMVDVHTVGAGGGSIAWRDRGGALRVGPQSAGRRAGAGLLRARGHRADDHRREPAARLPAAALGARGRGRARLRSGDAAPSRGWARSSGSASARPPRGSSGSPTRRWFARCGSSPSSAGSTPAGSRSSRSAAPARFTSRPSPRSSASRGSPARAPAASSRPSA